MKNYEEIAYLRTESTFHIEKAYDKGYDRGYNDCKVELLEDEAKCHYQEGYNDGYRKGVERGRESRVAEADCAYQCGLRKAWDAARKVMLSPEEGAIDSGTVKEIFGMNYYAVLKNLPVDEVISKIDAWEKKQERHCYNCGKPRDYKDFCIPYKEGKCEKSHKAWIPKQDAPESNVDTIEVGDEIKVVKNTCKYGEIGVVTFVRENSIDALTTRGYISTRTGNVVKTGRRFVIQAILDEMKSHEREI